jgi:hypothetical protein
MNKKVSLVIVAASIVIVIATLNVHLNACIENPLVLLNEIEALTEESDDDDDDIGLFGSLSVIPLRSFATPFQATKHSSYISVNYLVTLTNISVQIVNASGQTVYSNTVNPVAGGQLYISLTGLPAGEYTLSFTGANGGSIYGDFEI